MSDPTAQACFIFCAFFTFVCVYVFVSVEYMMFLGGRGQSEALKCAECVKNESQPPIPAYRDHCYAMKVILDSILSCHILSTP